MMASPTTPNTRASLLSGLRTGGVRSVSSPLAQVPHTAGATTSFIKPRISYSALRHSSFPEEDEDRTHTMHNPNAHSANNNISNNRPQTAAVDSMNNRMAQQQRSASGLNANSPVFVPGGYSAQTPKADRSQIQAQAQAQVDAQKLALQQLQMMQFEMLARQLNYQNNDAVQTAYLTEALRLQMSQQQLPRRASAGYQAPHTAGVPQSFAHLQHQARNASHGEHDDHQPIKTAGVGGKFAIRATSYDEYNSSMGTTVISGGTSLGTPTTAVATPAPSKSDAASSWRRGGNNNSVLSGNHAPRRESPPPRVRVTPPPQEQVTPSPNSSAKFRPRPLSLSAPPQQAAVVVDDADTSSSASSPKSGPEHSSPTTPNSIASHDQLPLSPREEASKKLYEGLGLGRASIQPSPPQVLTTQHNNSSGNLRLAFAPVRQPTGPPSNADEFGPKNFASRIRQKAVGGLGVLASGRERRLSFNERA